MTKADKKMGIPKAKYDPKKNKDSNRKTKKKPNKDKRPWQETYYTCPFCNHYLGKIDPTKEHWYIESTGKGYGISVDNTKTKCDNCGAMEIKNACPCCKGKTWYKHPEGHVMIGNLRSVEGEYRHQKRWSSCGFSGRAKIT